MQQKCLIHNIPKIVSCCQNCPRLAIFCSECQTDHMNNQFHEYFQSEILGSSYKYTKKYIIKELVNNYFTKKRKDIQEQLQRQYNEAIEFIESIINLQQNEQFLENLQKLNENEIKCQDMYQIYKKFKTILNSQRNNLISENQKMRLFQRYQQYSIEFKINSNFALKQLKKRIEGSLKVFKPEKSIKSYPYFIQSKVLQTDQQKKMVVDFFNKKVKTVYLLFRASENQFSSSKFHQKCDGIKSTVTILINQFGKKLGGYNPKQWESNLGYILDLSKETFIFSVDLKEKMDLMGKYGIWNSSSYGPAFGYGNYGHDLCISHNADKNKASYAQFPLSFNNSNNYSNNQKIWELFCGQNKGNNFLIKQWEVWKVQFQK